MLSCDIVSRRVVDVWAVLAGEAAGCRVVLVHTGVGSDTSKQLRAAGEGFQGMLGECEDLAAASDLIISDIAGIRAD